ncbi:MAG: hypothetical protein DI628_05260 [Blastochloris viridis]|uniref:Uncharacterized protein n=1 Tax=Blastochloris viridis TaxID=1079 RepID=A0A6N4RFD4_BLAVI|nr:MAG: hypothetical protein DI628_05260 [Blastochloris viridis]
MKTNIKNTLLAAVQESKERKDAAQKSLEAEKTAEQQFMDSFKQVRAEVIKPAMEELKALLTANGVICGIHESEERFEDRTGRMAERCGITMTFFDDTKNRHVATSYPHFTVYADKLAKNVSFHQSTIGPGRGGSAGNCGSSDLDKVTHDLIQEYVTNLVTKVV